MCLHKSWYVDSLTWIWLAAKWNKNYLAYFISRKDFKKYLVLCAKYNMKLASQFGENDRHKLRVVGEEWTTFDSFIDNPQLPWAQFGWNWLYVSREKDENVKFYNKDGDKPT